MEETGETVKVEKESSSRAKSAKKERVKSGASSVSAEKEASEVEVALQERLNELSIKQAEKLKVEANIIIPPIPRLDDLCVQLIAENYYDYPILDKIPPQYLDSIVALLDPTLITLETASKYIETEKFWKKLSLEKFKNCEPEKHGSSWKRLYLECNLQEKLESYPAPPVFTEEEELAFSDINVEPHASNLVIQSRFAAKNKAQEMYSRFMTEVSASRSFICSLRFTQLPSRLNLSALLSTFPNLSTIDISYGAKGVGMHYDSNMFGMKLGDMASLAPLLTSTRSVNRVLIRQSLINDDLVHILTSGLVKNETITALDLSHNLISDNGARRIAKLLEGSCVLTSLNLSDNSIHATGASFLGKALAQNSTLTSLDLRMNGIADGGIAIFDGMKRNRSITSLNLSSNAMGSESGIALQSMLESNSTLQDLDVSCNHIANEADDKKFKAAVLSNSTLTRLDLRKNDFLNETMDEILRVLQKREAELKQERRRLFQMTVSG